MDSGRPRFKDLNAITPGDDPDVDEGDVSEEHPEELEDEMVLAAIGGRGGKKSRDDRGKFSNHTNRREGSTGRRMLISAEEKKFCIEKNRCFICKQPDHSTRECANRYSPLKSDRR